MNTTGSLDVWEAAWATYDEATYQTALSYITPTDIVLDIGAGDLRFAHRAAQIARHVFAIECQPQLLTRSKSRPNNLTIICADARQIPWPREVTLGLLLMRHCTHVQLYTSRLLEIGCRRLITNARWGLDVEMVRMDTRLPWENVETGWFACLCGHTGFIPGPPDQLRDDQMWAIQEVSRCPACSQV